MQISSRREVNRRETWDALHRAAADIALAHGPRAVTVSEVAKQAGVSTRTFFNYFEHKDAAILGLRVPELDEQSVVAFREGAGDLLERTVRLVLAAFSSATLPEHVGGRRLELVRRHPELRAAIEKHVAAVEALVAPVLAEAGEDVLGERDAMALLMLASAIVRYAYRRHLRLLLTDEDAAVAAAIAAFRSFEVPA